MSVMKFQVVFFLVFSYCINLNAQTDPAHPNILVIIADDLGVDVSNGYQSNGLMPTTPTLDNLRNTGLTFMNAWSAPLCTPTRATTMSGKFGVKTGVLAVPGNLDLTHTSIFNEIANVIPTSYSDAVIGKWHISNPVDNGHPQQHGVDHYDGVITGAVSDYYNWNKVTNGVQSVENTYATSYFTDEAIDWVNDQSNPWFLWLAEIAPHSPFHVPPANLYTTPNVNTNQQKYVAAIEAMDNEIGRLLSNIPPAVLSNTLILYFGDNGTPGSVIQNYPNNHGKGTLYQGGIHVPMIATGPMVSRINEIEDGMVHVTDVYATILEVLGQDLPGGVNNSLSFKDLLADANAVTRPYNYSEGQSNSTQGWTIRNEEYKLIQFDNGTQEFYNLLTDPLETNDLMGSLTPAQETIKAELEVEGDSIRNGWSCNDLIQNGIETFIDDCSSSSCSNDNSLSTTNIGCCQTPLFANSYTETTGSDIRFISTNNFPDHDYCHTASQVPEPKLYDFEMDETPQMNGFITSILKPNNRPDYYFGVALNSVIFAPAPATPFIFENQNTGQYNWDWVFEPTTNQGSGMGQVKLDCASAHTGPQGYHYHGNMFEYAEGIQAGLSTTLTPPSDPVHIGWAADGYPILYRFGPDENGDLVLLEPGYQLKAGDRPGDGIEAPCGPYNGKYTNDYEHDSGVGDLDECNGIERAITLETEQGSETFDYFYMITDSFPQIGRCFVSTPNLTFNNANSGTVPLELISFSAEYNSRDNQVDLFWTTANEINVSHFEVERSVDGLDFETIGKTGATNYIDLRDYQILDKNLPADFLYYRLNIVDFNGSQKYSDVISVDIDRFLDMKVYPNPVIGDINITYQNAIEGAIVVEVLSTNGMRIQKINFNPNEIDNNTLIIPTTDLVPSIYFLRIWEEGVLLHQEKVVITQ